ncbi:MAG: acyl carrier protein [Paludibacteraceae bacterium]|nr:acyl carrier protein [Paludibacteraceae bacterium]
MITLEDFNAMCEELYLNGTKLTPETKFRDNDEFDSLIGYAMLMTIQENLNYDMSVKEFLSCHTTKDLYQAATKKH